MTDARFDRRRFLAGALGGAGVLALAGCTSSGSGSRAGAGPGARGAPSKAPVPRPTLRMPDNALGFPSPFASNGGLGYQQMILIYDTLLWKDASGKLLPWLARSVSVSDDHLTYTFEMRDGVKWSDGQPLTADDVVFTFDYYAKQKTLSPPVIIQPPRGIAKVQATGPTKVEITLEKPAFTFAEQVAGAVPIIPRHIWEPIGDPGGTVDLKVLVGSGPYKLESYNDDGGPLLYTARDDYFFGTPFVKRIEMNAIENPFPALLSGSTDMARGFGERDDVLAPFKANPEFAKITEVGSFVTSQLYFNLAKGGALADVKFRQACLMAIDRKNLMTRLAAGRGAPGNPGFLSPTNPFFTAVRQHDFDVAGANALLDAAGYRSPGGASGTRQGPDGKPLSFEFRFDNVNAVPLSEIMIPALKKIGVELRPKPATIGPDLFGPKLYSGFDMVVLPYPGPAPGGPNADPDVLRVMFSSRVPPYSLTNASGYVNPTFDDLADKQLATFDEAKRRTIVDQMQHIIADDIPVVPLFFPETDFVFRTKVLDQWYFTPGEFPTSENNKQLFITGAKTGTTVRPTTR